MSFICLNGNFIDAATPALSADNRSFKYGDGLIETMKLVDEKIMLEELHFERLIRGMELTGMHADGFNQAEIRYNIARLCNKNEIKNARVRLQVFRNEKTTGYVIEAIAPDTKRSEWNKKGLSICMHPFIRKSCDAYSNLKSSSRQIYVLAENYAAEKNVDECIVLNSYGNIADGSKTNIFIIKDKEILTPALDQGCVDGVMRRHVIELLKKNQLIVKQAGISVDSLKNADAVFLTNAIQGIKWVAAFENAVYDFHQVKKLADLLS